MLVAHCLPFCWPRCRCCSLWICTRTCLPLSRICTGIRPNPSHPIQWPQRLSCCVLLSWVPLSTCGELGFVMETDLVPNYPMGLQTSTPGVIVFACPGARSMSNDPEQCLLVEASQRSDLLGSHRARGWAASWMQELPAKLQRSAWRSQDPVPAALPNR